MGTNFLYIKEIKTNIKGGWVSNTDVICNFKYSKFTPEISIYPVSWGKGGQYYYASNLTLMI